MSTLPSGALDRATRTAAQVAGDLRRDFEAALHREGGEALPDPVLGILFQAVSAQVGRIYHEAKHEFPVAVLDDLMEGLAMPPRMAQPAQTVVRFSGIEQREPVGPDTQLTGYARTGDLLGFAPDEEIELSPTTLAFAGVYEAGRLYAVSGARVPDGSAISPGSVPLELAAGPTLYLAFEVDDAHLSGLGLFVDGDGRVTGALGRSPWQLLDERGCVYEAGVLRAWPGRAGVRRLGWLREGPPEGGEGAEAARALPVPPGPYGARVWVFPRIPPDRRRCSGVPPALADAAALLLPEEAAGALDRPLAWVQIPLPAELQGAADAMQRIEANCVTASNLEVWSEYVSFERMGSAFRVVPEGKPGTHVVGVLSVVGQRGDRYVEDGSVDAPPGAGRWRYRDGRVEVRAARHPTGQSDYHAVVRMLLSDGARGNDVDVGQVCHINTALTNVAQVTSLAVSREGKPPPGHADTKLRFAELLRTRERVVTAADVEAAVQAFEPRVTRVEVAGRAEPGPGGVARVVRATARVRRADFVDPDAELPRLQALLEEHLQARAVLGHQVRVSVEVGA